jgi:hypothetical protein
MDRKYLVYGIAGLVLILLMVLLGSCVLNRDKTAEEVVVATPEAEQQPVQPLFEQWEYLTIAATCSPDTASGGVVCYIFADNDNTSITNFMTTKGQQGWELGGVVSSPGGDPNTTFIFKRPLRTP